MKVLFCSHHFTDGFRFTQEFLANEPAIEVIRCESDKLDDNVEDVSVLVPQMSRISREIITRAKKLRLILQFGVGLEGVDIEAATEAGVIVARIPGAASGNAPSCAEMAIYLILSLLRNQRGMEQAVAAAQLGTPTGRTLQGMTVLIVGYGAIGKELALRLTPFGVRLLALRVSSGRQSPSEAANASLADPAPSIPAESSTTPRPRVEDPLTSENANGTGGTEPNGTREAEGVSEVNGTERTEQSGTESGSRRNGTRGTEGAAERDRTERTGQAGTERKEPTGTGRTEADALLDDQGGLDRRDELLAQADVIVLACLLTKETRGLVNESFLSNMKKDAILVNIARGHLLDYDAVRSALEADQLAGLGMDVAWSEPFDPSDPVARHPNVILTPHVAGVSDKSYHTMAKIIATSVRELHQGKPFTQIEVVNSMRT